MHEHVMQFIMDQPTYIPIDMQMQADEVFTTDRSPCQFQLGLPLDDHRLSDHITR